MSRPTEGSIEVNGTEVFIYVDEDLCLHLNESTSEQCEGCGQDIIETGDTDGEVVTCSECGAVYPIEPLVDDDGRSYGPRR